MALCARAVSAAPIMPADSVYAEFRVGNDTFASWIADKAGIEGALALWSGDAAATIPVGLLVWQPISWNAPWSWYLDPSSVTFAARTAETCDGTPSYVEQSGPSFGNQFCPWTAVLVDLQDVNGNTIPIADPPVSAPEPPAFSLAAIGLALFTLRPRGRA